MITHGESRTKLNKVWRNMKCRCYNPNNQRYPHYGGRGIVVCDEWVDSYINFRDWAISNGYKEGLSLDRINNDKDYTPDNCRWADHVAQNNNFSRNKYLTYNGVTMSMSRWAKKAGVHRNTLDARINRGWPIEMALYDTPRQEKRFTR